MVVDLGMNSADRTVSKRLTVFMTLEMDQCRVYANASLWTYTTCVKGAFSG